MKRAPMNIFTYDTKHLEYKDKVRFFYALKGRGGQPGIIKECNITQLAKTVLLVAPEHEKRVQAFLKEWECNSKMLRCLMRPEECGQDSIRTAPKEEHPHAERLRELKKKFGGGKK
ncbi:MAG: hypothetical protein QF486_05825 [Candidatus Woesearchaeota archaeon]|nr:hypothetical protein [Candidatus Woesearchaeota archaeon]MDP7199104.1 hypothetical protein [Candidatus Woesearchaeota archaeon]MDP7467891.1 hypothetical protein [Candidatus Woesearchaeota archaeon]MDP7646530.1 hypothetical protein [Candidatus Woesearchaeota archaeon]